MFFYRFSYVNVSLRVLVCLYVIVCLCLIYIRTEIKHKHNENLSQNIDKIPRSWTGVLWLFTFNINSISYICGCQRRNSQALSLSISVYLCLSLSSVHTGGFVLRAGCEFGRGWLMYDSGWRLTRYLFLSLYFFLPNCSRHRLNLSASSFRSNASMQLVKYSVPKHCSLWLCDRSGRKVGGRMKTHN